MRFPWKTASNAKLTNEEWLEIFTLYENRKDLFLKDILAMYERPDRPAPTRSRFYQIYRRWVRYKQTGKVQPTIED